MRYFQGLFGCALLLMLGSPPGQVQAGEVVVEVASGILSVHAVDVPLADVLMTIGRRARARVLIESVLEDHVGKERITASFTKLPMDQGLRRLLKNQNFILGFGATGVDEIRVYIDGRTGFRDLTAKKREPVDPSPPSKRRAERPPEDRAKLAQARHLMLTSRDPTARLEALEELRETQDTGYLLESVIEALGRERDSRVLEELIDTVRDRGPIPTAPLRALATSDRDGTARLRLAKPESPPEISLTCCSRCSSSRTASSSEYLQLMKDHVVEPDYVINLKTIPNLDYIKEERGGFRIGALVKLADLEEHTR